MKQFNYQGYILSILFIVLICFFTRGYYSLFTWFLLGLFLLLAFLKEENRLFAWVMISFFGGNLILFYTDKFIEGYQYIPFYRVIINQVLFLIPILSICYVIKQFNKKISFFFNKPEVNNTNKPIYIILLLLSVGVTFIFINNSGSDLNMFLSLFTFSLIHASLQEVMWRGILLSQLIKITNETSAILFTSITFAMNTTIFGFSTAVVLLYLILGFLFALLTIKYNSILPSIFAHSFVLFFFYLNDWLQLPL
ncbi:CPBP family intramembrane metalloprotease [Bacillus sp. EB106-08-02-XG196]|uniref:CPBP family intramembrane glutamic endopeptidase n=1 Tax=Bacillus sp. EB106-08-02-XG196 TaxID=2737049 RepID=UPI0015C42FBA|nr:CPBP family intramembrane glutamic endopeptidase [Bacillus sp. EB106-08-02-XG196]NWQ43786.1 CPBP family intramembrane metalloprotease [Bacillus sp. EB106-08-02-XG196]